MSALPSSWVLAGISAFGSLVGGKTPSKANPSFWAGGTIPWVSPKDMKRFEINNSEDLITEDAISHGGMKLLQADTVLVVTRSGILAHTLPVAITTRPVTINQDLKAIEPTLAVNSRYLAYAFRAKSQEILATCTKAGTTVASVETTALADLPLPLAPLAEQQRIADKLDTVLARVDSVNARLARVAPLLKRFRQSVLAAATSGRLTADWVADDSATWQAITVGAVCRFIGDGPFGSNLKSDDYTETGARVIRLENIGHLNFVREKQTFVSMEKYEQLAKHTLVPGDLLFSSFVDEEVRVCVFPPDLSVPAINKADCFCVRVNDELCNPRFLLMRLASRDTYQALKESVHGATRPRINLKQLRSFAIELPPLSEQTEIVRRVELLFAFADRLEARLQAGQTATSRLTPALLAKAFRGELVPQDPTDEPAAELLRRLAESRSATPAKGRGRSAAKTGQAQAHKG